MCYCVGVVCVVFFFKQKTAYEMRISDWSSDVCSSDLRVARVASKAFDSREIGTKTFPGQLPEDARPIRQRCRQRAGDGGQIRDRHADIEQLHAPHCLAAAAVTAIGQGTIADAHRSEEHTSELQSLMRISYAVFCLKKKNE